MRTIIIKYVIKFAIFVLQYALSRIDADTKGNKSGQHTVVIEDLQINPEAAKRFSNFIKCHTMQAKEK